MSARPPTLSRSSRSPLWLPALVLCAGAVATAWLISPKHGFAGLLVAGLLGLTLSVGAALFVAINAVTGARWCRGLEPVSSGLARTYPVAAVLIAVAVIAGVTTLYPWADHAHASHLVHAKSGWLNVPIFIARAGILLILFFGLTRAMSPPRGQPTRAAGAVFLVLFGVGISLAFWDWAMSLEPEWFSTMFGVYGFAGVFLGGLAAVTVVALLAARHGLIRLGDDQVHELGRLVFAFSLFWAYIWFCQYMLIWYANLPEEASWFLTRRQAGWGQLFWLNPIVSFVVPFFVLLSARAKRHRPTLYHVCLVVLIGRWLDLHLMVEPSLGPPTVPLAGLGATGLLLLLVARIVRRRLAA